MKHIILFLTLLFVSGCDAVEESTLNEEAVQGSKPTEKVSEVAKFKEGVHYDVIDAQASEKPEVREFFSFYCPHCYNYERLATALKAELSDRNVFVRSHVESLSLAVPLDQVRLTRALAVLSQLPTEQKEAGVTTLFDIIHRQRKADEIATDQAVKKVLVASGIDSQKIEALWGSATTMKIRNDMSALQNDLFEREQLLGVPSVVVNGRFLINHKGLDENNVIGDYAALLEYLLEK